MSGDYSENQASAVLEACARAAHESLRAVALARSEIRVKHWEDLTEIQRREISRQAAIALDIMAAADAAGANLGAADRLIEDLTKQIGCTRSRANLFMSVIAAVKATLDETL